MNPIAEDILMHYGMPRRSGRYPWGSGDNPYQHSGDFLSRIDELKTKGLSEKDIADSMKLTTTQLRVQVSLAKAERRQLDVDRAKSLRDDGLSLNEIAKEMGFKNDSSVRSLLNQDSEARMNQAMKTAEFIKKHVDEKGMIQVGLGVEREINVSREKLEQALYILELEGYPTYSGRMPQATNPGKHTTMKVLCPPGTEHKEIYNYDKIHSIIDYVSHDGGETFDPKFVYPKSMDSKRLKIVYAEDGGSAKDGLVEIRRGVDDLSLGKSHYAQVRILVDDTHYIKGMAIYSDDLPKGVDVRFNTSKTKDKSIQEVLKPIKTSDPNNPFGSLIKEGIVDPTTGSKEGGQSYYLDKNGKKQLSLINKRAEEGDWGEWADKLPSQFLAKQSKALINKQLTLTAADKQAEYDEICSLTNPTIKKALLRSFADDCDAAAVHLKAAALPRQKYQVVMPVPSIKEGEVYAPNYKDGEKVALVRYPHGGLFEIPILKVNNKHAESKKLLGTNPEDAIGINAKTALQLSGADFDGDTVVVIPTGRKNNILAKKPLKALESFDAKLEYGGKPEGTFKVMSRTNMEMGIITNLITDMTLQGASDDELARAVKHSMVVVDAEKHKLDYKQSEKDNNIAALKKKYQPGGGVSTLISRAKSPVDVVKRKGSPIIDPNTGKQTWKEDYQEYVGKDGKVHYRTQKSTRMAEVDDAFKLVSTANTQQEIAYAQYANKLKALGNQARKEMLSTGRLVYSKTAKETYQEEYNSLKAKINVALKNKPRERQAQLIAKTTVDALRQDNPDMTKQELKKASQRALSAARARVGAKRDKTTLSDREWEAIQAGAISDSMLQQIISNNVVDIDDLRQRAMPRTTKTLSKAKINLITSMKNSGYTTSQIADRLGVSASTVSKYLK